ncbi:MAG: uracil-DNA glycosylase [Rhodospirillales bacterium]|nr:uracil-DNA glycosylase [Rhodospirillales bacterium]
MSAVRAPAAKAVTADGPARDCPHCLRLVEFRHANRREFPGWHNAPVPSFGDIAAPLLIIGLAPGLKGANRSGRPFTGDYAGDLLYATLLKLGLAEGRYVAGRDNDVWPGDELRLVGARITNAVRCVPPANKPLPAEITGCRPFLAAELAAMKNLRCVLALGRVAHDAALAAIGVKRAAHPFGHGTAHKLPGGLMLADSYHCSRYNTNTGVLTPAMFERAVAAAKRLSAT